VTTSGGLKTVKQLSRIRTTKTKYCELSSLLIYEMFEFLKTYVRIRKLNVSLVIHENVQLRDVVMELKNALVALTGEFKATKESWAKDKKSWAADKESLARIEKSVDANAIRKMEKQLESYEDKIELKDKMIAKRFQ